MAEFIEGEKLIVISTGTSGFKIAVDKAVHYVGTFEQLTDLLTRTIVNRGRGKSTRFEIRPDERAAVTEMLND